MSDILDGFTCPVLMQLAPGASDIVQIDQTGDVGVLDEDVWDCPPYEDIGEQGDDSVLPLVSDLG